MGDGLPFAGSCVAIPSIPAVTILFLEGESGCFELGTMCASSLLGSRELSVEVPLAP